MPEGALTSFIVCEAYRYFAGQALSMTSPLQLRPYVALQIRLLSLLIVVVVGHAQNIYYQQIILQCLIDTLI